MSSYPSFNDVQVQTFYHTNVSLSLPMFGCEGFFLVYVRKFSLPMGCWLKSHNDIHAVFNIFTCILNSNNRAFPNMPILFVFPCEDVSLLRSTKTHQPLIPTSVSSLKWHLISGVYPPVTAITNGAGGHWDAGGPSVSETAHLQVYNWWITCCQCGVLDLLTLGLPSVSEEAWNKIQKCKSLVWFVTESWESLMTTLHHLA